MTMFSKTNRYISLLVLLAMALGLSAVTQAQPFPTDDPFVLMQPVDNSADSSLGLLRSLASRIEGFVQRFGRTAEFGLASSDRIQPEISVYWSRWLDLLRAQPEDNAGPVTRWFNTQLRDVVNQMSAMLRHAPRPAGSVFGPAPFDSQIN